MPLKYILIMLIMMVMNIGFRR